MRIGLLGGSFDPIHRGHWALAKSALAELALDRVLFLPTARPPHKPDRRFAPALARYAMAEIALLDEPDLMVSPLEMDETRSVYAIETIERLHRDESGDQHVLLIGADSLAELDTWREWRAILDRCAVGVLPRRGFEWPSVEPTLAAPLRLALAAATVDWIRGGEHPASSTEIRRRLRVGEPIPDGWLDPRVLSFVEKYRLYR